MVKFNPKTDIPDLSGKVVIVTGGNVGLGKETIAQLSRHNPAHIYLAARNESKARAAMADIRSQDPDAKCPITFLELDLASFASIKRFAADFTAREQHLHLLVNNAGIMAWPPATTADGYEVQFGTNHMGHALLTKLLLPTLRRTAEQHADRDVRVVNVSSAAERMPPNPVYDFAALKTDMAAWSTWSRYGCSKIANIHHARALARRHPELRCVAIHPGVVSTNLTAGPAASYPWLRPLIGLFSRLVLTSVGEGAKNQLWAATSPDAESGVFYWPVGVAGRDTPNALDPELADKLWEWTEKELEPHV
ncbi:putative oxidoreductase [Colletotrichum sidae]|uniref:Putative oxidoreductase n=1 Tax=Colletotrichum sidae TaxID=1347389 RepID=A0A4R8T5C3_9PEZI|nr:putative oxidoreductase [Colletotrichum sidae]